MTALQRKYRLVSSELTRWLGETPSAKTGYAPSETTSVCHGRLRGRP
jgi:hypothetical protein